MKIGVMTCWQPDDNYGTQIQCFALQHYLKLTGNEPYLIQYLCQNDLEKKRNFKFFLKALNPYLVIRKICGLRKSKLQKSETFSHNRGAPEFRMKYINLSKVYHTFDEIKKEPPKADLYIVGSDQVWNINPIHKKQFDAFFLNFGEESTKRISYAASFGFEYKSIFKGYDDYASSYLKKLDGISVRELKAKELCEKLGIYNAVQVADPTLLLSAEYYRKIYNENSFEKRSKKYILVYNLVSKSNIDIGKIKKFADKRQLDVVYVTGHGQVDSENKLYATIPEWLYLIDNAEYVITNSFHGSIFSSIFHKQFVVFPLKGNPTNSRLETLTDLLEQNRVVSDFLLAETKLDEQIDWNTFEKNKSQAVQAGVEFLNRFIKR